ncbi:MAG: hypothetical protein H0X02_03385 [Nitrosomonas sp.]|nr:hypothetical protein [Nitrosomonas sp.]
MNELQAFNYERGVVIMKTPNDIQMEITEVVTGKTYRAFSKWFAETFKDDIDVGAAYLVHCCRNGPPEAMVWDYLDKTGDKTYTRETFYKAARIIFKESECA